MKVGIIIQARMGSSRLPGKVLMPLPSPDGKPLLQHIVERVTQKFDVVIATSTEPQDDQLAELYPDCYRGSEDDVLSRFYDCTIAGAFDYVVRLTADNPVIDVDYLERTIHTHVESGADYSYSRGLPLGCNFEVISAKALIEAHENATLPAEREHVTKYLRDRPEQYDLRDIDYDYPVEARLTVDYPSDYEMVNHLFTNLPEGFGLDMAAEYLMANPEVLDINKDNEQVK